MSKDVHGKKTVISKDEITISPLAINLAEYSIQREIGRGGMAFVYEAVEKSLNRIVALKVLSKELSQDKDLIQRFVYEAQAAARLSHPNIVQIYSIGQERGVYYFAMEHIRGNSVEDIVEREGRINAVSALNIVRQTVLGLREAYRAGIIHRDIKPGNILVGHDGLVKIADFGLASEIKGISFGVSGRVIGTPLYMSPEQAQGTEGDHCSDMYSLGITLYQMITGKLPFKGEGIKEIIKKQVNDPIPVLPFYVPKTVAKLIYHLTNKDKKKRFSDYDELLAEVDFIIHKLTAKTHRTLILFTAFLIVAGVYAYDQYVAIVEDVDMKTDLTSDQIAEEAYKRVAEFAKKYPESIEYAMRRYSGIIQEYPGTTAAQRAEQKMDIIVLSVNKTAKDELEELDRELSDAIQAKKYKECIDMYMELKYKYKNTDAETIAQKRINYIMGIVEREFLAKEKEVNGYIRNNRFDIARAVYQEFIENIGIGEFVDRAKLRLILIDKTEIDYKEGNKAKAEFVLVYEKVDGLLAEHEYQDALLYLETLIEKEENNQIKVMLDEQIKRVLEAKNKDKEEKLQLENKKQEIEKRYIKVEAALREYKYKYASELLESIEKDSVDISESRRHKLLGEKIKYLLYIKELIIASVNNEVAVGGEKGQTADDENMLLIVEGGFVGVPWVECSPQKIYAIAKRYVKDDDFEHNISLGVFCLTHGLRGKAKESFKRAGKIAPEKKEVLSYFWRDDAK